MKRNGREDIFIVDKEGRSAKLAASSSMEGSMWYLEFSYQTYVGASRVYRSFPIPDCTSLSDREKALANAPTALKEQKAKDRYMVNFRDFELVWREPLSSDIESKST